jgi:hypothetical protein
MPKTIIINVVFKIPLNENEMKAIADIDKYVFFDGITESHLWIDGDFKKIRLQVDVSVFMDKFFTDEPVLLQTPTKTYVSTITCPSLTLKH